MCSMGFFRSNFRSYNIFPTPHLKILGHQEFLVVKFLSRYGDFMMNMRREGLNFFVREEFDQECSKFSRKWVLLPPLTYLSNLMRYQDGRAALSSISPYLSNSPNQVQQSTSPSSAIHLFHPF